MQQLTRAWVPAKIINALARVGTRLIFKVGLYSSVYGAVWHRIVRDLIRRGLAFFAKQHKLWGC